MEVDDVGVLRKSDHDVRDGRADIADHDAADDQNAHPLHPPGHSQHKGHRRHGTRKGGYDERRRAGEAPLIEEHHHSEGHGQLGTAGNAHDKRARNGVGKKGLEQIACCRERRTQQDHHDRPGEPQLQDDAHGERVLPFAQQGRQHGLRGQRNAAPQQIHAKQHQKPRREGEVG